MTTSSGDASTELALEPLPASIIPDMTKQATTTEESTRADSNAPSLEFQTGVLLNRLQALRDETLQRLEDLDKKMTKMDGSSSTIKKD